MSRLLISLLDLIWIGIIAGYVLGRVRPIRRARNWAENFIRFHDGTERFFGLRALLALILSADAVYFSTFLPWLRKQRRRRERS